MITLTEFLNKVNKQNKWITEIQALILLNFYLNVYGPNNIIMEIEDELIYMYDKLLEHNHIEIERRNKKLSKIEKKKEIQIDNQTKRNKLKEEEIEELAKNEVENGRICNECNELKPLELYSKNYRCRNGLNYKCKSCYNNYYKNKL